MNITEEQYIKALQAHDRLYIVSDLLVENLLEGNCNPPTKLLTAYFDAVDGAQDSLNIGRLHEQVVQPNADFYEDMQNWFRYSKKKNIDNTSSLF